MLSDGVLVDHQYEQTIVKVDDNCDDRNMVGNGEGHPAHINVWQIWAPARSKIEVEGAFWGQQATSYRIVQGSLQGIA